VISITELSSKRKILKYNELESCEISYFHTPPHVYYAGPVCPGSSKNVSALV
jgi:hypothetical protein